MAFSQQEKSLLTAKEEIIAQFETSGRFSAGDNKAKEVLTSSIIPKITDFNQGDGAINFSGTAQVNIVYVTIAGELAQVSGQLEFSSSAPKTEDLSDLSLSIRVCEKQVQVVDGDLTVNAVMAISQSGVMAVSFAQVEESDNVVVNKVVETATMVNATSHEEIAFIDDFKVNDIVEEVLFRSAQVVVEDVVTEADRVVLNGVALVNLIYKSNEKVVGVNHPINFRQEVSCLGAEANQEAYVLGQVSGVELNLKEAKSDAEETEISVVVNYLADIKVLKSEELELVSDAFTTQCQSFTTHEALTINHSSQPIIVSKSLSAQIDVSHRENIDQVCLVSVNQVTPGLAQESGVISAVVNVNAAIKNTDGQLEVISEDIPVEINSNEVGEVSDILAEVESFHLRGGKEIELNLMVYAHVSKSEIENFAYVSGLEEVAGDNDNESGITMYVVNQGDTLFDICRELRVRPEVVINQNENAQEAQPGDKIFVYNPQIAQF